MIAGVYEAVKAFVAQLAVPNKLPTNDVAVNEPVIAYEPVSCLEFVQTLPLLISKSPYDVDVDVSTTSCNSPNSYPLSIRT